MILLEEVDTELGNIKITRSKSGNTYTYYQNGCLRSQANKDGISTFSYVHTMYSIIKQSLSRRVLMIGCAGGTLATMLHRLGCQVTVLDINPYTFILARRYFQMPEEIHCIAEDSYSYLIRTGSRYDAIAIDAFNGDGFVPEELTSEPFFCAVKAVLERYGVITMNITTTPFSKNLADQIVLNMDSSQLSTAVFEQLDQENRNTIIVGKKKVERG
jgi:spermidine synthase